MKRLFFFASVFAAALGSRLVHSKIVWVEEAYPLAASLQMLGGKHLYHDIWFDKPPLFPAVYCLFGAQTGLPLRLAGALFVLLCCLLIFLLARRLWPEREAYLASALLGFFLVFDVPSALIPLAPDLLTLPFALLALWFSAGRRPFLAGMAAGAALWVNTKALYVLLLCALWLPLALPPLAAGFLFVHLVGVGWLVATGAAPAFWEQVFLWGAAYTRNTFVDNPLGEGARRSLGWAWFHAALLVPAAWFFWKERYLDMIRLAVWVACGIAMAFLGLRFFPRYYFHLLPPLALAAARGLSLLGWRRAAAMALLLLVPLGRYGPRYALLAADLANGAPRHEWRDLALFYDASEATSRLQEHSAPGETLFVWGYRPEIFALSRMPAGTRYLDSQPLTGVPADRHLRSVEVVMPELAARNRRELTTTAPDWIIDGLGPLNPALAITRYPDLAGWLRGYVEVARTSGCILYRRRT